jgi:phenylacetate-CoA ligase
MWATPFIRYETGDIAETASRSCSCGRNLPLLERIRGRAWDVVVLPDGRRLFGPYFHEIFARYTELRQWQIIQQGPKRLDIKLDSRGNIPSIEDRVLTDLRRVLPPEVLLHIQQVNRIETPAGIKFKVIDSRI